MKFDTTTAIQNAFNAHGLRTNWTDQGIEVLESGLVISANIVRLQNRDTITTVQLDVCAMSKKLNDKLLIESFAGRGSDESQAVEQAFRKFTRASMHTILAILVDPIYGEDQIEWESWSFENMNWRVCLGPVCFQGTPPEKFEYNEFLDRMKATLLPNLCNGTHWIRSFFMKNGHDLQVSEVLFDNLDFPDGRRIIDVLNWPDGTYSARQFLMITPAECR
jgi:hypothetical protein